LEVIMKRVLSTLFTAGLLATPLAAANAQASYVTWDGTRFDSDVGVACGALHTDVLFSPGERSVDLLDEAVLDYLATCFRTGSLAGARIAVVGFGDGSLAEASGADLARDRVGSVVAYLMGRGVNPANLTTWAYATGWPGDTTLTSDRVQFRVLADGNAITPVTYTIPAAKPKPAPMCTF
jgi:outer membrane protein OmpA-like peptidoglycan-associated protein